MLFCARTNFNYEKILWNSKILLGVLFWLLDYRDFTILPCIAIPPLKTVESRMPFCFLKTKLKTLIIGVTGLFHFYMPKGHTVVVAGYKLGVQNDYINVKVLKSGGVLDWIYVEWHFKKQGLLCECT